MFDTAASVHNLPQYMETDRVVLRLPTMEDAPSVFESFGGDADVMRLFPLPLHVSVADSEVYLRERIQRWRAGECCHWLLVTKADGRIIGMIGLGIHGHMADVGYVLNRGSWGHGLATEALRAVVDAAFATLPIYRLWGWCHAENLASSRVMEKAGMIRESLARRFGIFPNLGSGPRDAYIHAKVRGDKPDFAANTRKAALCLG